MIDRQAMIEEYISACMNCGGRDFPKRHDCAGCTDAVDEAIEDQMLAADAEGDRLAAITAAISTGG